MFILKFEFPSLFTRQATRNGYFVVLDLLEHTMNIQRHILALEGAHDFDSNAITLSSYSLLLHHWQRNNKCQHTWQRNNKCQHTYQLFCVWFNTTTDRIHVYQNWRAWWPIHHRCSVVYNTCIFTQHFQICRSMYDLKVVSYLFFKPHLYDMVKFLTKDGWFQRVFVHSPPMILTDTI